MENRVEGMDIRTLKHDLRAPIANVIALTQLSMSALSGGRPEGESVLPYLRWILAAAHELERLTGELTQGDAMREERFTAPELAQALSASIGAQASGKAQLLVVDLSGLGCGALYGGRTALVRILTNLLSNAVKYTPPGGRIRLSARRTDDGAEFVVSDNGIGMPADFLSRLYEPFARAPQAAEQDIPGSGLGLSIVRRLVDRLGGRINVLSAPGQGTTFTLSLPLRAEPQAQEPLDGCVLLAEDNDLSAQIACTLLGSRGLSAVRVRDGLEAFERFRAAPAGAFSAVLMDLHMPCMDGLTAARAIRALDRADAKTVPILALTAGADVKDERDALAAGMNACLQKPLETAKLCAVLGWS